MRRKHAGNYCVTASIDNVDFLQPVEVGELVSLKASVNYAGGTSLIVGIRVTSENIKNGTVKHTNTSYFTMVAKDDHHQSIPVPGLVLENREELRRFVEAMKRKELKKQHKELTSHIKTPLELEARKLLVANEKCVVKIEGGTAGQ